MPLDMQAGADAPALAFDGDPLRHDFGEPCPHCGEPAFIRLVEVWGHDFQIEACCEWQHEEICLGIEADHEYAAAVARWLCIEEAVGRPLRRVASSESHGQILLDYRPRVAPIDFPAARRFVQRWHRHNVAPILARWQAGVWNGPTLIAVAMLANPTSRMIDGRTVGRAAGRTKMRVDRRSTAEVTRLCVAHTLPQELTWKACSMLYRWAEETAAAAGYSKVITYTIAGEESGMSLRYARWKPEHRQRAGKAWGSASRPRRQSAPVAPRIRWAKRIKPQPPPLFAGVA